MCTGSCGRATQFSSKLLYFSSWFDAWLKSIGDFYVYLQQSKAAMPTNSVLVPWLHCISFGQIQAWTSCNFRRVADGFSRELHCTSSLSRETIVPSSNLGVTGWVFFLWHQSILHELLAVLQAIWSHFSKSMVSFECIQCHLLLSWHDGFHAFEFQGKLQAPESHFIDD